jgi:hypothetical protein
LPYDDAFSFCIFIVILHFSFEFSTFILHLHQIFRICIAFLQFFTVYLFPRFIVNAPKYETKPLSQILTCEKSYTWKEIQKVWIANAMHGENQNYHRINIALPSLVVVVGVFSLIPFVLFRWRAAHLYLRAPVMTCKKYGASIREQPAAVAPLVLLPSRGAEDVTSETSSANQHARPSPCTYIRGLHGEQLLHIYSTDMLHDGNKEKGQVYLLSNEWSSCHDTDVKHWHDTKRGQWLKGTPVSSDPQTSKSIESCNNQLTSK